MAEDRRKIAFRLSILRYGSVGVFIVLAVAFWVLQVVQHATYEEMAENNHQRTLALRAPRGLIFDRDGRVLVENRNSYDIALVREHTRNLGQTIRLLASVLGLKESLVREIVDRHRHQPSYEPIVIVQDASLAQVAAVMARRLDSELPDVVVEKVPTRRYPPDSLAAHLFGYVGEVSDQQVASDGLDSGDIVGQTGLEKIYNSLLMGEDGARRVVVNSMGREMRTLEEIPPVEGRRIKLTIDEDLQKAVEEGFRDSGYNGAAVILNPNTGEVLALTSLPEYNPNEFAAGIDHAEWASLTTDKLHPLEDRALQGRYSPGSTFKIVVATAALEEGLVTPDFKVHCTGGADFYGRYFHCWKKGGHGTLDMAQALQQSCDVYFYTLGNMLGVDKIHKWATRLGLGEKTGIDLPNEVQGLVPSTQWKKEATGQKWYAGETISVAIGQGQVSVTPVSLAVMISTIANGGTRVTPHLLKAVDDGSGWKPVPPPPPKGVVQLKPETIETLHEGLSMVVNQPGGTAYWDWHKPGPNSADLAGFEVAGKTGTAQVISLAGAREAAGKTDKNLNDHGWFVFFAPVDHPQIAGVVFAEHSGHPGVAAIPIARFALETYQAEKEGKPLPVWPAAPKPAVAAAAATTTTTGGTGQR
ncbi:MAG: penicillin-binding protein 2 [Acidobacteriota bacterium]|nr:penicillin-binding protein 2 [Acidobacteriota bacterium]